MIYSDLNAILLGEVVARVAGEPLDVFVTREVLQPFGLRQTMYRPPRALQRRVAPTGIWRGTPVAGQVHDANATKLGGVAGHAGLFGTADDLARFARIMRITRIMRIMRTTVMASSFSASLELAREGRVDLRQTAPFAPLYMRDRKTAAPRPMETENG